MGKEVNHREGAKWSIVEPPISSIFHVSRGSTTSMKKKHYNKLPILVILHFSPFLMCIFIVNYSL